MSVRRFFCECPPREGYLELHGDEIHHIRDVTRLKTGAELEVTDGKGWVHHGAIDTVRKESLTILVKESHFHPKPAGKPWVAVSLLKGKGMHLLIERLTEMGVERITPVIFSRSDLHSPDERKTDKWQKIAEQAIKVNDKPWLPAIDSPVALDELVALSSEHSPRLLLDLEAPYLTKGSWLRPKLVLIGPPGGITIPERETLVARGFDTIRLSPWTLRSETAALYAVAWLETYPFSEAIHD